jgi:hypothetical protein
MRHRLICNNIFNHINALNKQIDIILLELNDEKFNFGETSVDNFESIKNLTNFDSVDQALLSEYTYAYIDNKLDSNKNSLKQGSVVEIEWTNFQNNEARIVNVFETSQIIEYQKEDKISSFIDSPIKFMKDFISGNNTGDGEQNLNSSVNNTIDDTKCGSSNSSEYPIQECKKGTINGSKVTLHPVFYDKISNLLNEIKANDKYEIKIGESKRSKQNQYNLRRQKCPQAETKMGESFKTATWTEVLSNGPCNDVTSVAAVEGPYASNHIFGLAVDFAIDIECPAKNKNSQKYEICRQKSKVYNLINK